MMARKLRIEYPGAFYHVINRGNYRSWIFESEGARLSFLSCLEEVCVAMGWRVHSWVLMSNHYHLCLETPEPNLVEGMKWLQSTFANRFNRYRNANGHVFQGRYQAILLDPDAVGAVCHYIHLNPVRAGLVIAADLQSYSESGFHQIWYPSKRWSFFVASTALGEAGDLSDTRHGRSCYRDYLEWLSSNDMTRKQLGFEKMCKGWAKGSKDFKQAVMDDLKDGISQKVVESEAKELRGPLWERRLQQGLSALEKTDLDLVSQRKSADWKVALARHLRECSLTPNRWIAERLSMGTAESVSSRVSHHRKHCLANDPQWESLKMLECVD
jgi:REP element-mobilizing transposase RayT